MLARRLGLPFFTSCGHLYCLLERRFSPLKIIPASGDRTRPARHWVARFSVWQWVSWHFLQLEHSPLVQLSCWAATSWMTRACLGCRIRFAVPLSHFRTWAARPPCNAVGRLRLAGSQINGQLIPPVDTRRLRAVCRSERRVEWFQLFGCCPAFLLPLLDLHIVGAGVLGFVFVCEVVFIKRSRV